MRDADDAAPDPLSPDALAERAERRLRLLHELAELGMEMAREQRALAGEAQAEGAPRRPDPVKGFATAARAVRLTLALEERFDAALKDAQAHVRAEAQAQRRDLKSPAIFRRLKIEWFVGQTIEAAAGSEKRAAGAEFDKDYERLHEALYELDDAEAVDRPTHEIVERICADLGLTFDWSRWDEDDITELEADPRLARRKAAEAEAARKARGEEDPGEAAMRHYLGDAYRPPPAPS